MAYTKFTGWETTTLPVKMRAALANMEEGIQQGIDAAADAQSTANTGVANAATAQAAAEAAQRTADTGVANAATAQAAAEAAQSTANTAKTTADGALQRTGGTMSGAINMGGKSITNLAAPTADAHAATKKYVDDAASDVAAQIGDYLPKSGGAMSGPIDMNSNKITEVPTPQASTDAANKQYVDDTVSPVSSVANSAASTASAANTTATNAKSAIDTHTANSSIHVAFSTTNPVMDGTASPGDDTTVARSDHKHPTDTSRQATITGAATTITASNLTASRALVSNSSGKVAVSDVTATELGYLDGVTSNVQTQLNQLSSEIANLSEIVVHDQTNNIDYKVSMLLINGKPAISYQQV